MSTHNLCFEQKYEKYQNFLSENFYFWIVKFSVYLNEHVFGMTSDLYELPIYCIYHIYWDTLTPHHICSRTTPF